MQSLAEQYLKNLNTTMQELMQQYLKDEDGFGVMLRYALGWSDAQDQPYNRPTGKRLRPLLLLLCATINHDDWQIALPAAAAVELLHNFSLIHDDIQDNSTTRHNRPTVWKVWGIANAINAGDAMFTLAYSALANLAQHLDANVMMELWSIFNATNLELTRGQHLDMRFETQTNVSVEEYISMIKGKSAALISASAQMGSLITSKNSQLAQNFADFGMNIGIAFQIHDDILGIWGNEKLTGKSTATDIISRKKSLPILFGLEKSPELMQLYSQPQFDEPEIARTLQILDSINAQEYTRQQEIVYYNRANDALKSAQLSPLSLAQLQEFVDFLFDRNY